MELANNHITYVEFKAKDIEKIKEFYTQSFNWFFTDFGSDYTAFSGSGLAGGFEKSAKRAMNGALVILYHENLELIKASIIDAGGKLSKDVFTFPGGRRFHFKDPSGNELAVWSDK